MAVAQLLGLSLLVLLACFFVVWLIASYIDDVSIIDLLWGPACAIPAWVAYFVADGTDSRKTLLVCLVSIWALRLAWHLSARNLGAGEDPRYTRMRKRLGPDQSFAWFSLTRIFALQAVLAWLISWPVQIGQIYDTPNQLGILAYIGAAVWLCGILFEAIGDYQLKQFKAKPENAGKLMDQGLWAWTRHPNYFGDSLVWFGLSIIALENWLGLIAIASPFLMLHFLVNWSGKALLERDMAKRYPDFETYQSRVSGFFPKPPKN